MKNKVFYFILIAVLLIFIEASFSTFLLYRYRAEGEVRDSRSIFSTVVIVEKVLIALGLKPPHNNQPKYEFEKESIPSPFFKEDDYFGYAAMPGTYSHFYKRRLKKNREEASWEQIKTKVTINLDGSRWTGSETKAGLPNIYILGDSYVFGSGVSDEQTFSYHLQMAIPRANVRLFALPDYNSAHTYRRIQLLKNEIKDTDIIIIGYAHYFDHRNVAAPSWLRARKAYDREEKHARLYLARKNLKADMGDEDEKIRFSFVEAYCEENEGYCEQPEPTRESMAKITAALINGIAAMTPAKVYLLYFEGDKGNPVLGLLDKKIRVISVLPEDFDYYLGDDIAGFDSHPGPYWHYAISRRLIEKLSIQS